MALPLYVDLDGTLIRGDTMRKASLLLLRRNPFRLAWAGLLMLTNRPKAKTLIARVIDLDVSQLQYRPEVLQYITAAREEGRRVVLATGTHQKYADAVAQHLRLFDAAYGTTENGVNLTARNKLAAIQKDGGNAFEYWGDSHADVVIFEHAAKAVWVGSKMLGIAVDGVRLRRLCPEG